MPEENQMGWYWVFILYMYVLLLHAVLLVRIVYKVGFHAILGMSARGDTWYSLAVTIFEQGFYQIYNKDIVFSHNY